MLLALFVLVALASFVAYGWMVYLVFQQEGVLWAILSFLFCFPILFFAFKDWQYYRNAIGLFVGLQIARAFIAMAMGDDSPNPNLFSQTEDAPKVVSSSGTATSTSRYSADSVGYERYCAKCHTAGIHGAPRMGDNQAWAARIDEAGRDKVMLNAYTGIGDHPALGGCDRCTPQQVDNMSYHLLTNSGVTYE